MKYEKPALEVEEILMSDVICSSIPGGSIGGEDNGDGDDNIIESPDEW